MADEPNTPLSPSEYAVGRKVKYNDQTVTIQGALTGDHGSRFLLASAEGSAVCGLIEESLVRDEFQAVEDTPTEDNTAPSNPDAPVGDGTDGTQGTGV